MNPLHRFLYLLTVSIAIGVLFAVSVPPFLQMVNFDTPTDRWWYAALFVFPYSVLVSALRPPVINPLLSGLSIWQAIASLLSYNIRYLILTNRVRNIPRQNVVYRPGEIPEVRASSHRASSSSLSDYACT